VVVSHSETVRDVGREAAEVTAHALADRFQSLEACGSRTRAVELPQLVD
jgi:hypothetical protein